MELQVVGPLKVLPGLMFAAGLLAVPLLASPAEATVVFSNSFEAPVVNHTGPSGSSGGYDNYGTGSTIGPWTVVGPVGRSDAVSVVTTNFTQNGIAFPAQSGAQWADLAGQDSNGTEGVETTVTGLAGQAYAVSFWVGNVVDPNGVFGVSTTVNLFVDGASVFSAVNTDGAGSSTQVWHKYTYSGVGASNSTVFRFLSGDPSSDFSSAFDNVVITTASDGVPEPSTWAMMLIGFAGVGLMVQRHRARAPA
jgi:hypothetical protein